MLSRMLSICALLLVMLFARPAAAQKEAEPQGEGCPSCHEGIEAINPKMATAWGADTRCEVCHYGRPSAATKLEAHTGLISNPGDLRVVEHTCGKCHSDHGEIQKVKIQGIDDHVGRVLRSLMATAAGEIAGTRYMWNEQSTRSALYGVRAVLDRDRNQSKGAVERLQALPPAANSDADSLLRGACLRCHLWTEDKTTPGIYRPGGCTACHVLYAEDGMSKSGDPTISRSEPGHAESHSITTKIPDSQCLWCHNNGGARVGLSYVGLAVTNPTLGPHEAAPLEKTAYGAKVMHTEPDIHFRRGIACIDCHDSVDLHGDGNIYSHQEDQVGIRCESCHGSYADPPEFRTSRDRPLAHVKVEDGKPYLDSKLFDERHPIPLVYTGPSEKSWMADVWHKGHQRLECYACHSTRVPECYACHMVRDDRKPSPIDWVSGVGEQQATQPSAGSWTGRSLLQLWENPILGVNRRNRTSPFMPGGQAIVTHLDSSGDFVKANHTFTTPGGLYGFSMNPVQPHSIDVGSRTCGSCHSSDKALGLGSGLIDLRRLGLSLNFSPDRFVDEEGSRMQDSAHENSRPFNGEELAALRKTELCIECHETAPGRKPIQSEKQYSIEEADRNHHEAVRKLLLPESK